MIVAMMARHVLNRSAGDTSRLLLSFNHNNNNNNSNSGGNRYDGAATLDRYAQVKCRRELSYCSSRLGSFKTYSRGF